MCWLLSCITILVSCSYLTAGLYRDRLCVDALGLAAASIIAWESSCWQKRLKFVFDKIRWIKTIQSFPRSLQTFNIRLKKRWHLCQPLGGSNIGKLFFWRPFCWHRFEVFSAIKWPKPIKFKDSDVCNLINLNNLSHPERTKSWYLLPSAFVYQESAQVLPRKSPAPSCELKKSQLNEFCLILKSILCSLYGFKTGNVLFGSFKSASFPHSDRREAPEELRYPWDMRPPKYIKQVINLKSIFSPTVCLVGTLRRAIPFYFHPCRCTEL